MWLTSRSYKQVIHLLQYGASTHSFSYISGCNAGVIFRHSIIGCYVVYQQVIHVLQYCACTHSFSDISRCNAGVIFRHSIVSCYVVY